jgi:hypothetical protein
MEQHTYSSAAISAKYQLGNLQKCCKFNASFGFLVEGQFEVVVVAVMGLGRPLMSRVFWNTKSRR